MMDDQKGQQQISDAEFEAIFGYPRPGSVKAETPTAEVDTPTARKPRSWAKTAYVGALVPRILSSIASGVVGAVPSPVTTPAAALIGGAGEYAGQYIESGDDYDHQTALLEAGLSAVPMGKVFKAGKVLANMGRGAALMEAGNMARRVSAEGSLINGQDWLDHAMPETTSEWMWDAGTSTLGGLGGALPVGNQNAISQALKDRYTDWREPTVALGNQISVPGSIGKVPSAVQPKIKLSKVEVPEVSNIGSKADGTLMGPGINPKHADVPVGDEWSPAEFKGSHEAVAARAAELQAEGLDVSIQRLDDQNSRVIANVKEAPKVEGIDVNNSQSPMLRDMIAEIDRNHAGAIAKIDPNLAKTDPKYSAQVARLNARRTALHNEAARKAAAAKDKRVTGIQKKADADRVDTEKAHDVANQMKADEVETLRKTKIEEAKAQEAANKLKADEAEALRKQRVEKEKAHQAANDLKAGEAETARKTIVEEAKAQQAANDLLANEKRIRLAKRKIRLARQNMESRGPSVTSTTEKVPTPTGSTILRESFGPKKEDIGPIDPSSVTVNPSLEPPKPKTPKPKKVDPKIANDTGYASEDEAQKALGLTDKAGTVKSIGKGKWIIEWLDEGPDASAQGVRPMPDGPAPKPPAAPAAPVDNTGGKLAPKPAAPIAPVKPTAAVELPDDVAGKASDAPTYTGPERRAGGSEGRVAWTEQQRKESLPTVKKQLEDIANENADNAAKPLEEKFPKATAAINRLEQTVDRIKEGDPTLGTVKSAGKSSTPAAKAAAPIAPVGPKDPEAMAKAAAEAKARVDSADERFKAETEKIKALPSADKPLAEMTDSELYVEFRKAQRSDRKRLDETLDLITKRRADGQWDDSVDTKFNRWLEGKGPDDVPPAGPVPVPVKPKGPKPKGGQGAAPIAPKGKPTAPKGETQAEADFNKAKADAEVKPTVREATPAQKAETDAATVAEVKKFTTAELNYALSSTKNGRMKEILEAELASRTAKVDPPKVEAPVNEVVKNSLVPMSVKYLEDHNYTNIKVTKYDGKNKLITADPPKPKDTVGPKMGTDTPKVDGEDYTKWSDDDLQKVRAKITERVKGGTSSKSDDRVGAKIQKEIESRAKPVTPKAAAPIAPKKAPDAPATPVEGPKASKAEALVGAEAKPTPKPKVARKPEVESDVDLKGATTPVDVKKRVVDALKKAYDKATDRKVDAVEVEGGVKNASVKIGGKEVATLSKHGSINVTDPQLKAALDLPEKYNTRDFDSAKDMAEDLAEKIKTHLYESDPNPKLKIKFGNSSITVTNDKHSISQVLKKVSDSADEQWDGIVGKAPKEPVGIKPETPWDNSKTSPKTVLKNASSDAEKVKAEVMTQLGRYASKVAKAADEGDEVPGPITVKVGDFSITTSSHQVKALMEMLEDNKDIWQGLKPSSDDIPPVIPTPKLSLVNESVPVEDLDKVIADLKAQGKEPSIASNFDKENTWKVSVVEKEPAVKSPAKAAKSKPAAKPAEPKPPVPRPDPVKEADSATKTPKELKDLIVEEADAAEAYGNLKDAVKAGTATNDELRAAGKKLGEVRKALATAVSKAEDAGQPVPSFAKGAAKAEPKADADGPRGRGRPSRPMDELEGEIKSLETKETRTPAENARLYSLKKQHAKKNDAAKLSPEKQAKRIDEVIDDVDKRGLNEKGIIVNHLVQNLGLSLGGALAGAAATPDDPITGAILGGGLGLGAGVTFRAVQKRIDSGNLSPEAKDVSRSELGAWAKEKIINIGRGAPNTYRAFLLSHIPNLPINAFVGPYGAALMGSAELAASGDPAGWAALKKLTPRNFWKEYKSSWEEAKDQLRHSTERAEMDVEVGPELWKKVIAAPATVMTAGDMAARKIMMDAGIPEEVARAFTMTTEPFSGFGASVGHARKAKSRMNEKRSPLVQMAIPFYRTNVNQIEQGLIRLPFGNMIRESWGITPVSKREAIVQTGMSLGNAAGGFYMGSFVPKEDEKVALKFISNFGGVYGSAASIGFLIGVAMKRDKQLGDAMLSAGRQFLTRDLPMPSAEFLFDSLKMVEDLNNGKMPDLPYGAIPAIASSKQTWSVPTIGRDPVDWVKQFGKSARKVDVLKPHTWFQGFNPNVKKTEKERGPLAPLFSDDKAWVKEKRLTPAQEKLKRIKDKRAAMRKKYNESKKGK